MAVNFDASERSVLAVCDQCPWLDIVTSMSIARRVALEHLWRVHPELLDAINAQHAALYRGRVAVAKPSGVSPTVSVRGST